jgi:hypothetical protein
MAVNNKEPISAYNPLLYILIKVLQPLQPKLIYRLAVLRDYNNPVLR